MILEHNTWKHLQSTKYLKPALGKSILFIKINHSTLEAYLYADWAGSKEDRRSNTGYCVFLVGNLVTWRNKKRNVVSRSSFEAE